MESRPAAVEVTEQREVVPAGYDERLEALAERLLRIERRLATEPQRAPAAARSRQRPSQIYDFRALDGH